MRLSNVQKFENEINAVEWEQVTDSNDPQMAYSEFHKIVSLKVYQTLSLQKINQKIS